MIRIYSTAERKRFVAALRAAKPNLYKGTQSKKDMAKTTYICEALGWNSETAEKLIMYRLGRSCGSSVSVGGYLCSIGIPARQLNTKNIQTFRHLWLDSLILEFSK